MTHSLSHKNNKIPYFSNKAPNLPQKMHIHLHNADLDLEVALTWCSMALCLARWHVPMVSALNLHETKSVLKKANVHNVPDSVSRHCVHSDHLNRAAMVYYRCSKAKGIGLLCRISTGHRFVWHGLIQYGQGGGDGEMGWEQRFNHGRFSWASKRTEWTGRNRRETHWSKGITRLK